MLLSFELTMPNVASWNGKWSGSNQKYFIVETVSMGWVQKQPYFRNLIKHGFDNFSYDFGDGWRANIHVQIIAPTEARKRREMSAGFCGYEWMVESIIYHGSIMTKDQIKHKQQA